jgi:hypothetical protein
MEMIGHQHVRVNPASAFYFGPAKTFQKEPVIIVGKESSSAIISALNNVMRISRNCDSRRSCHFGISVSADSWRSLSPHYFMVKEKSSLTPFSLFDPIFSLLITVCFRLVSRS